MKLLHQGRSFIAQLLEPDRKKLLMVQAQLLRVIGTVNQRICLDKEARERFLTVRANLVTELANLADLELARSQYPDSVAAALELLGIVSESPVYECLIRNLEFKTESYRLDGARERYPTPAFKALSGLGRQAVPAILEAATRDLTESKLKLLGKVLFEIAYTTSVDAVKLVRTALDREQNPLSLENLKKFLQVIEKTLANKRSCPSGEPA